MINIAHDSLGSIFYYNSSHTVLVVDANATVEIVLTVTASKNATDGDRINFIVTAATLIGNNQRSNFVTFVYIVSTLPPANQTENVSERHFANIIVRRMGILCRSSIIKL